MAAESKQIRDEWLETDLGKLSTWERRHAADLRAFEDNPDDPGEVWYGDDAHEQQLEFLFDLVERSAGEGWEGAALDPKTSHLCDLGCGNALFAVDAVKHGWVHCVAMDYSTESMLLSTAVVRHAAEEMAEGGGSDGSGSGSDSEAGAGGGGGAGAGGAGAGGGGGGGGAGGATDSAGDAAGDAAGAGEDRAPFKEQLWKPVAGGGPFSHLHLMQTDIYASPLTPGRFHVIAEKGLLDASQLNPDALPVRAYADAMVRLLVPGGLFIITSGNWTVDELVADLGPRLQYVDHVAYPEMLFGGRAGATKATVAFRAVKSDDSDDGGDGSDGSDGGCSSDGGDGA